MRLEEEKNDIIYDMISEKQGPLFIELVTEFTI